MSKINGALYNELCDDAQQLIIQSIAKLEKSNKLLRDAGYIPPAEKGEDIIKSLKLQANTIDTLPGFDDENSDG